MAGTYDIENVKENWYKSLPYAFESNIGGKRKLIYLPLNPSNITITTHYATELIPTIGGTVEVHSDQRYFDISISGTTGIAPKYTPVVAPIIGDNLTQVSQKVDGREFYQGGFLFANSLGGFFSDKLAKLDKAKNLARDAVNSATGGPLKPHESGVKLERTGYYAFHRLYLFFQEYKNAIKKAAEVSLGDQLIASGLAKASSFLSSAAPFLPPLPKKPDSTAPLSFINYKDNNRYSCVINKFTMTRDASTPMMYNYNISLTAYDLTSADKPLEDDSLEAKLFELGLSKDKPSLLSRVKGGLGNAKGAINSVKSILGR
jgi:hypothetical protein